MSGKTKMLGPNTCTTRQIFLWDEKRMRLDVNVASMG